MTPNINEANSLLGIDIGSVSTRAVLFDVVEQSYHFVASGVAPTTDTHPYFDVGEGVFQAISQLQEITGRLLLNQDGNLLIPSQAGGEGVDRLVITTSCGPLLKLATFGLLNDVSLESVNKLALTTYGKLVDSIGINDRRPPHAQMDALLEAKPDLILFAGGTDGGASRSVWRMAQLLATSLQLIPQPERPRILFCGNHALSRKFKEAFEKLTAVQISSNIRPIIDEEQLDAAVEILGSLTMQSRYAQISGLQRMVPLCSDIPLLSSIGLNRVIRFLGRQYDPTKGVLGVDIGSSTTTTSYSNGKQSALNVFPFGMGTGASVLAEKSQLVEITRWLQMDILGEDVRDYLYQKSLYPGSIPADQNDLAIELAAARHILRLVVKEIMLRNSLASSRFEPILVSGSVLTRSATPQQTLLTILDGIQPLGICPVILDKHGILPLLGAAGKVAPLLPVQLLESTAFTNLATVVNAASAAREGTVIMHARLEYNSGNFIDAEVKQGSIVALPLSPGETGSLHLRMVRRTYIDDSFIQNEPVKVSGGVCGVVIDARGRPLHIPENIAQRAERFKSWEFMLGGK